MFEAAAQEHQTIRFLYKILTNFRDFTVFMSRDSVSFQLSWNWIKGIDVIHWVFLKERSHMSEILLNPTESFMQRIFKDVSFVSSATLSADHLKTPEEGAHSPACFTAEDLSSRTEPWLWETPKFSWFQRKNSRVGREMGCVSSGRGWYVINRMYFKFKFM